MDATTLRHTDRQTKEQQTSQKKNFLRFFFCQLLHFVCAILKRVVFYVLMVFIFIYIDRFSVYIFFGGSTHPLAVGSCCPYTFILGEKTKRFFNFTIFFSRQSLFHSLLYELLFMENDMVTKSRLSPGLFFICYEFHFGFSISISFSTLNLFQKTKKQTHTYI